MTLVLTAAIATIGANSLALGRERRGLCRGSRYRRRRRHGRLGRLRAGYRRRCARAVAARRSARRAPGADAGVRGDRRRLHRHRALCIQLRGHRRAGVRVGAREPLRSEPDRGGPVRERPDQARRDPRRVQRDDLPGGLDRHARVRMGVRDPRVRGDGRPRHRGGHRGDAPWRREIVSGGELARMLGEPARARCRISPLSARSRKRRRRLVDRCAERTPCSKPTIRPSFDRRAVRHARRGSAPWRDRRHAGSNRRRTTRRRAASRAGCARAGRGRR